MTTPKDRRCLSEAQIERIQVEFYSGVAKDDDLLQIFSALETQRRVLRELFSLFVSPPFRRYSHVESVPNSQLAYLKELVAMED